MNYSIIILTSVTAAKRAQKILERNGMACAIVRTPSEISEYGCSNSLKINNDLTKNAVVLLNKFEFNIRGIYKETYDGHKYRYIKQRV